MNTLLKKTFCDIYSMLVLKKDFAQTVVGACIACTQVVIPKLLPV